MKISNLSLPHPVLGLGDDVDGKFKVSCEVSLGPNKALLEIKYDLENKSLTEMIKNKSAVVLMEVHCPKTFFRKPYQITKNNQEIEIKTDSLRGKVNASFFIVALKNNRRYVIENANDDYKNFVFEVESGDVLAWGGLISFPALKDWRALKAADSFLVIDKYEKKEGPIRINMNHDKVVVELSKNDYEKYEYYSKKPSLFPIYHSSIIFPALVYILNKIQDNPEEYEDFDWFVNLNIRKQQEKEWKEYDWDSPEHIPLIAQQILGNPVSRMLTTADGLMKMIQNED